MSRVTGIIKTWMTGERLEALQAVLALFIVFAVGVACATGDTASTSSANSFGVANAGITGKVTNPAGTALSGVRVATDRGDYWTTTDASGNYQLQVSGAKKYNVFATNASYVTIVSKDVSVDTGQNKTVNLQFVTALAAGEKTYVGSSVCKTCHANEHAAWANSPHRYGISAPGDSPGILAVPNAQFVAGTTLSSGNFAQYGALAPKLSRSGDTYIITIGNVAYPVNYAMGYQWKQRYITKIGEANYILPIQYNVATAEWVDYNLSDWYIDSVTARYTSQATIETNIYKKNSWERKCLGCHSVTGIMALTFDTGAPSGIAQHRATWLEKGIGCEACHGPASLHAAGSFASIVNPADLSRDRYNDICGQCHARGVSVEYLAGGTSDTYTLEYYYKDTSTFRPGDVLANGYTDGNGLFSNTAAEMRIAKQHHQQWNDLYQSGHTAPGAALNVTCGSCHSGHGSTGQARMLSKATSDNTLCLSCHGPSGTANQRFSTDSSVIQHTGTQHRTYNPSGASTAGRCITCHMVRTAKTAINQDITSHSFRVIRPHNSYRYAVYAGQTDTIANSCQQSCHEGTAGKGNNFGLGTAGNLLASQHYDSTVERPSAVDSTTGSARISGKVTVTAATSAADNFGIWVSADYTNRSTVTDRDGAYWLLLDAPGTYTIRAGKPGYDSASVVVNAESGVHTQTTVNLVLVKNANARFTQRAYRCNACHGATFSSEWRQSGFTGAQLSEAEGSTDLSAGHSLMASSPAGNANCARCHEARNASFFLTSGDTNMTGLPSADRVIGAASRRGVTCDVCHKPHDAANTNSALKQYNTTGFDTNYMYLKNSANLSANAYGSPIFPPTYKATACILCHSGRTAPTDSGTGMKLSGGKWVPVSTPHVGNNSEGFFGSYQGTSEFVLSFDSVAVWTPRGSTHSDTLWGQTYSYQAFVYQEGTNTPKLVSAGGAPIVSSNERFTCVSCHMFSQIAGDWSGNRTAADGGHTWKPDIRACAVCHDPNYIAINPYANTLKSGTGDTYWGVAGIADSWGVSSTGQVLGFDRPAAYLPHKTDNGRADTSGVADGIFNDYDGNGIAEGAHTEAKDLFERVVAAMNQGTYLAETSGIIVGGVTVGMGDTFPLSHPYWNFDVVRGAAGIDTGDYPNKITKDELRVAWNLVLFEHDETNLGVHNLRFAIETLRNMWRAIGRHRTGISNWIAPGDDY